MKARQVKFNDSDFKGSNENYFGEEQTNPIIQKVFYLFLPDFWIDNITNPQQKTRVNIVKHIVNSNIYDKLLQTKISNDFGQLKKILFKENKRLKDNGFDPPLSYNVGKNIATKLKLFKGDITKLNNADFIRGIMNHTYDSYLLYDFLLNNYKSDMLELYNDEIVNMQTAFKSRNIEKSKVKASDVQKIILEDKIPTLPLIICLLDIDIVFDGGGNNSEVMNRYYDRFDSDVTEDNTLEKENSESVKKITNEIFIKGISDIYAYQKEQLKNKNFILEFISQTIYSLWTLDKLNLDIIESQFQIIKKNGEMFENLNIDDYLFFKNNKESNIIEQKLLKLIDFNYFLEVLNKSLENLKVNIGDKEVQALPRALQAHSNHLSAIMNETHFDKQIHFYLDMKIANEEEFSSLIFSYLLMDYINANISKLIKDKISIKDFDKGKPYKTSKISKYKLSTSITNTVQNLHKVKKINIDSFKKNKLRVSPDYLFLSNCKYENLIDLINNKENLCFILNKMQEDFRDSKNKLESITFSENQSYNPNKNRFNISTLMVEQDRCKKIEVPKDLFKNIKNEDLKKGFLFINAINKYTKDLHGNGLKLISNYNSIDNLSKVEHELSQLNSKGENICNQLHEKLNKTCEYIEFYRNMLNSQYSVIKKYNLDIPIKTSYKNIDINAIKINELSKVYNDMEQKIININNHFNKHFRNQVVDRLVLNFKNITEADRLSILNSSIEDLENKIDCAIENSQNLESQIEDDVKDKNANVHDVLDIANEPFTETYKLGYIFHYLNKKSYSESSDGLFDVFYSLTLRKNGNFYFLNMLIEKILNLAVYDSKSIDVLLLSCLVESSSEHQDSEISSSLDTYINSYTYDRIYDEDVYRLISKIRKSKEIKIEESRIEKRSLADKLIMKLSDLPKYKTFANHMRQEMETWVSNVKKYLDKSILEVNVDNWENIASSKKKNIIDFFNKDKQIKELKNISDLVSTKRGKMLITDNFNIKNKLVEEIANLQELAIEYIDAKCKEEKEENILYVQDYSDKIKYRLMKINKSNLFKALNRSINYKSQNDLSIIGNVMNDKSYIKNNFNLISFLYFNEVSSVTGLMNYHFEHKEEDVNLKHYDDSNIYHSSILKFLDYAISENEVKQYSHQLALRKKGFKEKQQTISDNDRGVYDQYLSAERYALCEKVHNKNVDRIAKLDEKAENDLNEDHIYYQQETDKVKKDYSAALAEGAISLDSINIVIEYILKPAEKLLSLKNEANHDKLFYLLEIAYSDGLIHSDTEIQLFPSKLESITSDSSNNISDLIDGLDIDGGAKIKTITKLYNSCKTCTFEELPDDWKSVDGDKFSEYERRNEINKRSQKKFELFTIEFFRYFALIIQDLKWYSTIERNPFTITKFYENQSSEFSGKEIIFTCIRGKHNISEFDITKLSKDIEIRLKEDIKGFSDKDYYLVIFGINIDNSNILNIQSTQQFSNVKILNENHLGKLFKSKIDKDRDSKGQFALPHMLLSHKSISSINPFITEATVTSTQGIFVGREKMIQELTTNMNSFYIYGSRRVGKSSICKEAKKKLSKNASYIVHYATVQSSDTEDPPKEFDAGLHDLKRYFSKLAAGTNQNVDSKANIGIMESQTFNELKIQMDDFLERNSEMKFCLILDECDHIIEKIEAYENKFNEKNKYQLITTIKALKEKPNIKFILSGFMTLYDKFNSRLNAGIKEQHNPFEGLADPLPVTLFNEDESKRLLKQGLENDLNLKYENPHIVNRILKYTGCHPAFIQKFCFVLVHHIDHDITETNRTITEEACDYIFKDTSRGNFLHYVDKRTRNNIREKIGLIAALVQYGPDNPKGYSKKEIFDIYLNAIFDYDQKKIDKVNENRSTEAVLEKWLLTLTVTQIFKEHQDRITFHNTFWKEYLNTYYNQSEETLRQDLSISKEAFLESIGNKYE